MEEEWKEKNCYVFKAFLLLLLDSCHIYWWSADVFILPSQHCAPWVGGAVWVMVQGSWSQEPAVKPRGSLERSSGLWRVQGPTGIMRLPCFLFPLSLSKVTFYFLASECPFKKSHQIKATKSQKWCTWLCSLPGLLLGDVLQCFSWLVPREEVFLSAVIATRKYCFDGDQIKN